MPAWVALVLGLCLCLSRVPLVNSARFGSEIVNDEADLTLMAVDRFFALPMTNTHWPAVTNQVLMVPVVGVDFLLGDQKCNADGFAVHAGSLYRSPERLVALHRALVVALTSLATVALMLALRRHGWLVATSAALLLQNTHLIVHGTLGLGNGPALAAMIGIGACMLSNGCPKKRAAIAGLLLGLALASRNTSILIVPLLLGWIAQTAKNWKEAATLIGLGVAGCFVGSSPAWVLAAMEPIRWVKANVGNFVKVGPPAGVGVVVSTIAGAAGWWFWVLAFLGVAAVLVHRRHVGLAVGWLISLGGAVLIASRSPDIEARYFDAIFVGAVIVVLAIASEISRCWQTGLLVASLVFATFGWFSAHRQFIASEAGIRPEDRRVVAAASAGPGELVIVDRSFLLARFRSRATSASLRVLADGTERAVQSGEALREFVQKYDLSPEVADVLARDLTEKEQNEIGRLRVAALAPPIGEPIDVTGCADNNAARRYGAMSVAQAVGKLRQGEAGQAIVLAESAEQFPEAEFVREPLEQGRFVRIRRR